MIQNKFDKISSKYWLNSFSDIKIILKNSPLTNAELKEVVKIISENMDNNKKTKVINWITVLIENDADKALISLKEKRIFKLELSSKNRLQMDVIKTLLNNNVLKLNEKTIEFFHSKKNLLFIHASAHKIFNIITTVVKSKSPSFIRDLLIVADSIFYTKMTYGSIPLGEISEEEICEACSFLIFTYLNNNKSNIIDIESFSEESSLDEEEIDLLIRITILLKKFEKADFYIDIFGYVCNKNKNIVTISSREELFEMSRKYGYIHSDVQMFNSLVRIIKNSDENSASYNDVIEKFYEFKDNLFVLKTKPIKRYSLNLPSLKGFKEMMNDKSLFMEEYSELTANIKENPTKLDLTKFKIHNKLTLWDLVIIKRVFVILGGLIHKFLSEKTKENKNNRYISYCSWMPVYLHKDLDTIISHVIGEDKSKSFIEIFSWSYNSSKLLDIQYTPLINIGQQYYFPINIFKGSNIFRNALISNKTRPQSAENFDFTSNILFNILKKKFRKVKMELEFHKFGFHGDFDVIANIENVIYVFECKNIINPATSHELRTTYVNLNKGLLQLNKCRAALSNDEFQSYMNKKLNWNIDNNTKIVTCLVFSNRMFNGYFDGQSHVRSIYELTQFIKEGTIIAKDKKLSLWGDEEISGNDMYEYIQNSLFHTKVFDSMESNDDISDFPSKKLIFKSFQLNIEVFLDKLNETNLSPDDL